MLLTVGDDPNPETLPMPAAGESTPTEQLAPLPITMPMPAFVPPRPGAAARADAQAPEDADAPVPEDDEPDAREDVDLPEDEDPDATEEVDPPEDAEPDAPEYEDPDAAPTDEAHVADDPEAARPASADAPTQAIAPIGAAPAPPPQNSPAVTRPKALAWSNLPNSEPIPLGAVAGGIDVTGTHPTLPPASSYTAVLAARTGTTAVTATATTSTSTVASPVGASSDAADPTASPAPTAKKRHRHRALIVTLSTTAVVLVLLGIAASIGWQVAETHASSVVKQTVQEKVDKALGLPTSHPVAVKFDEPVLPQVWAKKLDTLTFTVAGVPLVGSKGTVTIHATDVPTDGSGTAKTVEAKVRLKPDALKSLVTANRTALGQILPGSVKVEGSKVTVSLNPAQFLSGVSFTEVLQASIKDESLVLTPKEFIVGGLPMSADTVRARFGGLAHGILATRTICLADTYPSGMTLTGLEVKKEAVVADFDVQPGILTDAALQAPGTCR